MSPDKRLGSLLVGSPAAPFWLASDGALYSNKDIFSKSLRVDGSYLVELSVLCSAQ